MFHKLVYVRTTTATDVLADSSGVADTVFTQQNSHFIFTDQLQLLGAASLGATATQAQIYSPSLIPYGLLNIWPLNAAIVPPSYPRLVNFTHRPYRIPMNEQIQMLVTDSAIEQWTGHMWIASAGWKPTPYVGKFRAILKVTASQAIVANSWSGLGAVTFANLPIGGWYVINRAWCLGVGTTRAFRLYFPRSPGVNGRQFRPGDLVSHASGDLVTPEWQNQLGPWGSFHTFEPPQVEVYGDTAGAQTQTMYWDCDYVGPGDANGTYPLAA